jgi:hypothetical protein
MTLKSAHSKCRKHGTGVRGNPRVEEREKRMLRPFAGYEMLDRNMCATTSIIQL